MQKLLKMKNWNVYALILALLLFGTVLAFSAFKSKMIASYLANVPEARLPVEVVEVAQRQWQPLIPAIGVIEPVQGVQLSTSVSGLVKGIHFQSGEKVKKGELLLTLDSDVEKANLAAAKSRLPASKSAYERNLSLYERKAVPKKSLDESQSAYMALRSEITSLEAVIARREIRAPFSGVVGLREVHLGQYLQAGNVITRLENIEKMLVRFIVPQKRISSVAVGSPVKITTDAYPDHIFDGEISAIDAAVDAASGVIHVQASIPNSDELLRVGMFASLNILQPVIKSALVIPTQTINFSLYGELVYVVEKTLKDDVEELRVWQRTVAVAERQGPDARISKGLEAGDQIVTSGQVRLHNGALVKLVEDHVLGLQ